MAKVFKSNLPKVISKANRDISTIIENDIAAESKLLKELVDQVLKSNLEVKKKNNQRITETKRKLSELDEKIGDLTNKIDLVDRETVIQQLNEMIDAENKIFSARQEIRFFDNEKTPERLDSLDSIYKDLISSIQKVNKYEETFREGLLHSNELLFDKQLEFTKEAIKIMDELFDAKRQYVTDELEKRQELIEKIKTTEDNSFVYTRDELLLLLDIPSYRMLSRTAKIYRDTNGRLGIPNIQLAGSGSRVIYPKSMIDSWLMNGNKIQNFNDKKLA